MEDKNAEAILALLQGMEAKINKQDELISSLLASKNETPTPKPVELDVIAKQKLLDEARTAELQQGNLIRAVVELDSFLAKNHGDYEGVKAVVDAKNSYPEKLKELEKAVFVMGKEINDQTINEFDKLQGSFAEEGTGINIKIKEIVDHSEVETPNYFAQGGKSLTRENLVSKVADFYKKLGNSNEELPKIITTENLEIRGN